MWSSSWGSAAPSATGTQPAVAGWSVCGKRPMSDTVPIMQSVDGRVNVAPLAPSAPMDRPATLWVVETVVGLEAIAALVYVCAHALDPKSTSQWGDLKTQSWLLTSHLIVTAINLALVLYTVWMAMRAKDAGTKTVLPIVGLLNAVGYAGTTAVGAAYMWWLNDRAGKESLTGAMYTIHFNAACTWLFGGLMWFIYPTIVAYMPVQVY